MVPYIDAVVVSVTMMCVLLCMLYVCMLRECEGDGNAGMADGGVVVVITGHVGGTRGSGSVSSATDVLVMGVVRGMRGVGGDVYVFVSGGVRGEGVSVLVWALPILWKQGGACCTCVCVAVVWVESGYVLGAGFGGVVLCLCKFGFSV